MGKPGTISPKARLYLLAGWAFPSKFKYVSLHGGLNIHLTRISALSRRLIAMTG